MSQKITPKTLAISQVAGRAYFAGHEKAAIMTTQNKSGRNANSAYIAKPPKTISTYYLP